MFQLLLLSALVAQGISALPGHLRPSPSLNARIKRDEYISSEGYQISGEVENGTSKARFDIPTPELTLDSKTLFSLDAPQIDTINGSVFDWWYFDAVSETNPDDSFVITFFASSWEAFPFLNESEPSVLTAWVWASFANGTVFADFVPATVATVRGADVAGTNSSGEWASTGVSWEAKSEDLSRYEITIASEKMGVEGRFTLSSHVPHHLPCGIQEERTTLEVAPHIGWVSLVPDAVGEVDVSILGSKLKFRGPGYHDKNWSDRPFMDSVASWYWGHGRLGPYSIVWFSYFSLEDPTNTTYVSSYVAKDGELLVSACNSSFLSVRPIGSPGTTGGRYPPRVGDVPDGFRLEYDLGEGNGQLNVNVTIRRLVTGDEEYYMRWTGDLTGEVVKSGDERPPGTCAGQKTAKITSGLIGVAVLEQFLLVE
ncbi:uncharacterized protein N7515_002172 [Penicillium bovifimosum]|uniref:Hydroxyneurosporene synthase n=1 Tax=Penicillium bovifimosum TaxID=126998 RepID=A0A9W9L7U2_9EURO|nr:uncharacterized protein N7515_002172 [Penicillium bovifimosum]KAJ5143385.1 hypothetical protein N7515_002172 [Penicillium bovifimosum]